MRLGMKRKRAMSVPSAKARPGRDGEVEAAATTMQEVKSEVTFANGAQVAKWKLNGTRYKRCKVTVRHRNSPKAALPRRDEKKLFPTWHTLS
jgi:hypothetical protein